jgi:hypothetical protein
MSARHGSIIGPTTGLGSTGNCALFGRAGNWVLAVGRDGSQVSQKASCFRTVAFSKINNLAWRPGRPKTSCFWDIWVP